MNHTGMGAEQMFGDPKPGTSEAVQAAWQRRRAPNSHAGASVSAEEIGRMICNLAEASDMRSLAHAMGKAIEAVTSAARAERRERDERSATGM